MTAGDIPPDIRMFILRHFESIAELEALLLLRANPQENWDVPKVTARLYTGEREVATVLARLCEGGLLACENGVYRFACKDEKLLAQAEQVAALYATQLIPVTNLIHSKLRRIQEFAGAFRLRKDR
jgi:hypothetical protein